MKVFYSYDFEGHWPVGSAAIVIEGSRELARLLLDKELADHGLEDSKEYTLVEMDLTEAQAIILCDGDY